MKTRKANKSLLKRGIKREIGLHYDFIQVTHVRFKAESQAVGFLEVLQVFWLNGNFLVICQRVSASLPASHMSSVGFHAYRCICASAHAQAHIHTEVSIYSWHRAQLLQSKKKKYFGHKVAADHGLEMHFSLSVLSRCLTFDIMKSQDIVASRADKRAAFTVHLTSLFERQINFLWCRRLSQ